MKHSPIFCFLPNPKLSDQVVLNEWAGSVLHKKPESNLYTVYIKECCLSVCLSVCSDLESKLLELTSCQRVGCLSLFPV